MIAADPGLGGRLMLCTECVHSAVRCPDLLVQATEQLWLGRRPAELPPSIHRVALRKLTQLHAIQTLDELLVPPGNRLEALKGDRKGQHRIRVNDQYRVCFVWDATNAREVEVVDYH